MANHPSAAKRHKQSIKHNIKNRKIKSSITTAAKKLLGAVSSKDSSASIEHVKEFKKLVSKAASKKVYHKNAAKRKISRMEKKVSSLKK